MRRSTGKKRKWTAAAEDVDLMLTPSGASTNNSLSPIIGSDSKMLTSAAEPCATTVAAALHHSMCSGAGSLAASAFAAGCICSGMSSWRAAMLGSNPSSERLTEVALARRASSSAARSRFLPTASLHSAHSRRRSRSSAASRCSISSCSLRAVGHGGASVFSSAELSSPSGGAYASPLASARSPRKQSILSNFCAAAALSDASTRSLASCTSSMPRLPRAIRSQSCARSSSRRPLPCASTFCNLSCVWPFFFASKSVEMRLRSVATK
mmetsp:Transcript_53283/g.122454  ORF Transcript_53283/g.122454 Transcript_53283/m.122454 type:complete len:267 (-) Transcript_53283:149-949(-)